MAPMRPPIYSPEDQITYDRNRRIQRAENQRRRRQAARNTINDQAREIQQPIFEYDPVIQQDYLGKMDILCIHCKASHFLLERVSNRGLSFNDYCSHGAVKQDPIPTFPKDLTKMFNNV